MRGTLRTVGTIAFCVVIAVSGLGCRTGPEGNEPSVSQTAAPEAPLVAGKSTDGDTTPPAAFDATKPIGEPNGLRSPSYPTLIYEPGADAVPVSRKQVEDIKSIVRVETQRETWFILVLDNEENLHPPFYDCRVEAYAMPGCQSSRIQRGSAVHIAEGPHNHRIWPFSYAYVCETAEAFPPDLAPPADLTRLPFRVFGDISDQDIVEVVRFIRSGPSVPEWLTHAPPGKIRRVFNPDHVLDPTAPIQAVSRGKGINVNMAGERPDIIVVYGCQKINGAWTLVHTSTLLVELLR